MRSTIAGFALALVMVLITLLATTNVTNTWTIWYPKSGFIILEKSIGKEYGKWQYVIQDAYQKGTIKIIIRSNNDWNTEDTLFLNTHP